MVQDKDWWRALVNMVMNLQILYSAGMFLGGCSTDGFLRRDQLHIVS
jgi:hypothetical protein